MWFCVIAATLHLTLVFRVIPLFSTHKDTPLFYITQELLKINFLYTVVLGKWDKFFNSQHHKNKRQVFDAQILAFFLFEVLTKIRLFLGYLFSSEVYFDMIRRNKSQAEDSSSAEIASIFSSRPWA